MMSWNRETSPASAPRVSIGVPVGPCTAEIYMAHVVEASNVLARFLNFGNNILGNKTRIRKKKQREIPRQI